VLADFGRADLPAKLSQIEAVFARLRSNRDIGAALFPDDGSAAEDLMTAEHRTAYRVGFSTISSGAIRGQVVTYGQSSQVGALSI